MRICFECKHHVRLAPNNVWYNQLCGAMEREEGRDPVTGQMGYKGQNDLGGDYLTEKKHPYCRSINTDGECPRWEKMSAVRSFFRTVREPRR